MQDFIEEVDCQIEHRFASDEFVQVDARKCGLDPRSAYSLYVSEECVVVPLSQDGSLQYYGGFEYVPKHLRVVVGSYVIYFSEDSEDRVGEIIDRIHGE